MLAVAAVLLALGPGALEARLDRGLLPRCHPRKGSYRVLRTRAVLVTAASSHDGDRSYKTTLRACARPAGRDRVIGVGESDGGGGSRVSAIGASGTWVVTAHVTWLRYYGCQSGALEVVDAAGGARGRRVDIADCDPSLMPFERAAVAVTAGGVPAWVVRDRLLAAGADGAPYELDRGAITALRADGPRVVWTRDGVERSAEL